MVLPNIPGVDAAPNPDELKPEEPGKKLFCPPKADVFWFDPENNVDWFPKVDPKLPEGFDPRVLGAPPRLRVGGPAP